MLGAGGWMSWRLSALFLPVIPSRHGRRRWLADAARGAPERKKQKAACLPRERPLIRLRHLLPSAEGRRLSVCAHRKPRIDGRRLHSPSAPSPLCGGEKALGVCSSQVGVDPRGECSIESLLPPASWGEKVAEGRMKGVRQPPMSVRFDPANIGSFLEASLGMTVGFAEPYRQPTTDNRQLLRGDLLDPQRCRAEVELRGGDDLHLSELLA